MAKVYEADVYVKNSTKAKFCPEEIFITEISGDTIWAKEVIGWNYGWASLGNPVSVTMKKLMADYTRVDVPMV